tara:strand:+ start:346 stop:564 length:219 start_codon:yes stop_codon:yes gene_type:complete
MRSLEDCNEEIEDLLLKGETVDLLNLCINLQRNDVLADIEGVLQILSIKMNDIENKLDNIAFNLSNISKDIV